MKEARTEADAAFDKPFERVELFIGYDLQSKNK
jgi:hypothetical protein